MANQKTVCHVNGPLNAEDRKDEPTLSSLLFQSFLMTSFAVVDDDADLNFNTLYIKVHNRSRQRYIKKAFCLLLSSRKIVLRVK